MCLSEKVDVSLRYDEGCCVLPQVLGLESLLGGSPLLPPLVRHWWFL